MNKMTPFAFGDHLIRVVEENEAPWFVAKEVADALGIAWQGEKTLVKIKEEWRRVGKLPTPGGEQDTILISEPAVYKLAFRSNKPEAERFTDWVVAEVLPSIRKTGQYQAAPQVEDISEQSPDGIKLRKVNTAARCFGERAGAQLWAKLGLDWVPAMAAVISQDDLFDNTVPPGVTITVNTAHIGGSA